MAAADCIADALGQRYVESVPLSMEKTWAESSPKVPIICLLSQVGCYFSILCVLLIIGPWDLCNGRTSSHCRVRNRADFPTRNTLGACYRPPDVCHGPIGSLLQALILQSS